MCAEHGINLRIKDGADLLNPLSYYLVNQPHDPIVANLFMIFCDLLEQYIRILMMYLKEKESEKGEKDEILQQSNNGVKQKGAGNASAAFAAVVSPKPNQ